MSAVLRKVKSAASRKRNDPLALVADCLVSKIPALGRTSKPVVLQALHDMLDGADASARTARKQMQLHLIKVSDSLLSSKNRQMPAPALLTTEEAAQMMGCSRPYAAMLIDAKKLAGAIVTTGGHRRVPEASVRAWMAASATRASGNYKAAARAAGMYDIPEENFISAGRAPRRRRGA